MIQMRSSNPFLRPTALPLPLTLMVLAALAPGMAQEQEGIGGVLEDTGFSTIKIAVPDPVSNPAAGEQARTIADVLRQDLEFSGYFDVVDPTLYGLVPAATSVDEVRHDDWLSIGADALLLLQVESDGARVDLSGRLLDNNSGAMLFGRRYGGRQELLRRVAHQLADDLVRHYTGRTGVAMTRIAFVSKHGEGKEIYLMDYDGRRIRRLTTTHTINLSPTWSPPGDELAFVSWRGRQPGVYVMSADGELGHLDTIGGELSAAPDWSHDGRRLVYSSDFHGNTELYVLDRTTGRNSRLTHSPAIDTSPAYSPNGRQIAFTSDRTGSPQVYLMDAEGMNIRRVSWSGSYNDSAAWSPVGDRLAYVSRIDGRFDIVVLELGTDKVKRLTWGEGNNENPRWSPDGRHIVFASDRAGSFDIYTMRANGDKMRRLTRDGNCFTPDWSR
jgi:TolB protein